MKKVIAGVVILVVIAVAVVAVVAMNNNDSNKNDTMANMGTNSSSKSSSSSSSSQAVATNTVEIKNFAFSPSTITVKVGTKVTWTNKDSIEHTVTADVSSSDAPSSDQLGQGQSYSFTFNKAGTYAYHCSVHPDMTAKVIVTE